MIKCIIKFIVNPYDPDSTIPKWWPNYIMEREFEGKEFDREGYEYYRMRFLFGKQYLQEFENYIETHLKGFIADYEKSEL